MDELNNLFGPPRLIHRQTYHNDDMSLTQETSLWESSVEQNVFYLEQVTAGKNGQVEGRVFLTTATLTALMPHLLQILQPPAGLGPTS